MLVTGGHHFAQIAFGYDHACGLTTDAAALCWGTGRYGELGTGTSAATSPTPVLGGHRFTALWAGDFLTCGRTVEVEIYCWGKSVSATADAPPSLLAGAPSFVSLSMGDRHRASL